MSVNILRRAGLGLLICAVVPAAAHADPLTPIGVFEHAAVTPKLMIIGLIAATLAAIVVSALKVASGPRLSGGSAFISGLRLGGPLAGLVGASYSGLAMALNLANTAQTPPANIIARGASEVLLLILLGVISGAVAVVAHWAIEARIDRTVLGA